MDKATKPAVILMLAIGIIALIAAASNGALDGIFGGTDTIITQGFIETDPGWNAKGELAVGEANNAALFLPVGTDGQVLTASSTTILGVEWTNTPDDITVFTSGFSQSPPLANVWYLVDSITVPNGKWRLEYDAPISVYNNFSFGYVDAELAVGTSTSTLIAALTSPIYLRIDDGFVGDQHEMRMETVVNRSYVVEPLTDTVYQMFVKNKSQAVCIGVGYNCATTNTSTATIRAVPIR